MGAREWLDRSRNFLVESGQEARRVTWPTPREIVSATLVVIAATAALAILLALYDLVISNVLRIILK